MKAGNMTEEMTAAVDVMIDCRIKVLCAEIAERQKDADLRLMIAATEVDNKIAGLENRINKLKGEIVALRAEILDA